MRVIMIGANAAGMSAAAKLKRMQPGTEVVLYEARSYISFGACGLPYFIGGFFEEEDKMLVRTPEQAAAMGLAVKLRHKVVSVNEEKKEIIVLDQVSGKRIVDSYDKLMIASGASAIVPSITQDGLKNVFTVRTLQDGRAIREYMRKEETKKVTVIGAGFIGLELVDVAIHLGKEVEVFQRANHVLNDVFDEEVTKLLEQEMVSNGVSLYLNTNVEKVLAEGIATKVIANGISYETDLVIIATGIRPNTSFLENTSIKRSCNGAIIVDEYGRTSVKDIYAAGDCATVPHLLRQTETYLPLATTANKLGRIVGENLAGANKVFPKTLGASCIKLLSLEAGRVGLKEEEAKSIYGEVGSTWIKDKNHTDYYPGQEEIGVKLVYRKNDKRLLGAEVVGKSDAVMRTNVLSAAITAGMTTEQLGMLDLCYAPPFARTWDVINIAGNAAK